MSVILQGVPNVNNYLDDITCFGRTQALHDTALQEVLQRLTNAGLRLNDKKCRFRQSSLRFLGHLASAQGIEPDTKRVKAIAQALQPHDAGTLRSFLGMLQQMVQQIHTQLCHCG